MTFSISNNFLWLNAVSESFANFRIMIQPEFTTEDSEDLTEITEDY